MFKVTTLALSCVLLTACQTLPERTVPEAVAREIPIIHPQPPAALELEPVKWEVWNKARIQAEANKPGDNVWFVLDENEGKKLALNMTKILDYMTAIRYHNNYYRTYLDDYNLRARKELDAARDRAKAPTTK